MAAVDTLLLRRAGRAKKASTIASDKSRINGHIKPLLGNLAADALTAKQITKFMHDVAAGKTAKREKLDKKRALSNVRGGKGAATRTVGLLGAIFTYAVTEGIRPDNPVHGVTRFADKKKDRRLSDVEYEKLGEGLDLAATGGVNLTGIAAVRLLILTGWRTGDAVKLLWDNPDTKRRVARLQDTKSDARVRPLSLSALELILAQPRTSSPYVFPARIANRPLQGLPRMFDAIKEKAKLAEDITPHVLRHSFCSLAGDPGYNDAVIGALAACRSEFSNNFVR